MSNPKQQFITISIILKISHDSLSLFTKETLYGKIIAV